MILLDTQIWIWWAGKHPSLKPTTVDLIREAGSPAVSLISCRGVAKLTEKGKLTLDRPAREWIDDAIFETGVALLEISLPILLESASLPGPFHRDPADQIIVATSRWLSIPLLTADAQIRRYPHVALADR